MAPVCMRPPALAHVAAPHRQGSATSGQPLDPCQPSLRQACPMALLRLRRPARRLIAPRASADPHQQGDPPRSSRKQPGRPGRHPRWLQQLRASWAGQHPLRLLLNVVALFFVLRLWPLAGRPGLSDGDAMLIQVRRRRG
jgi:hypothetical protein